MKNEQVIKAFLMERTGKAASLVSDGKRIYSYGLQIGDTSETDKKIVRDYTKNGSYGFRSMTTSTHVGLLRFIKGHETIVV